ncbi:MAG: hypothetical protein HY756_05015 [Nitrospirae bacterium]|nr:hypothetical protein [Nitrospirota bacterium]
MAKKADATRLDKGSHREAGGYADFISYNKKALKNKNMKNFITNTGSKNLRKRLVELIRKSDELKFLVGFFYFSGIRELYEGLKDNPDVNIKVLVGLNVDKTNFGLLEFAEKDTQLSDEERCYKFLQWGIPLTPVTTRYSI